MISKPCPQRPELDFLIQKAIKAYKTLSPEAKKEQNKQQRISWVYENLSLSNPDITREMIEELVENE